MFYQIFLSPQVKRWMIITYRHGIYELPHELKNNLKLRILGNQEISAKYLNLIEWQPSVQSPCKNKNFAITSKSSKKQRLNFSRGVLFHTKTRVCLKYFVADCRILHSSDTSIFYLLCTHIKLGNSIAFHLFSHLKEVLCYIYIYIYISLKELYVKPM